MRKVLRRAAAEAGVEPVLPGLPERVQAVVRQDNDHAYLFLLNHGTEPATVRLPVPAPDLLTDPDRAVDAVTLAPRGVAVLGSTP
jgi:beta-galactosidase